MLNLLIQLYRIPLCPYNQPSFKRMVQILWLKVFTRLDSIGNSWVCWVLDKHKSVMTCVLLKCTMLCLWIHDYHTILLEQVSHLIFWVLKWLVPFAAKILSLLINLRHLAPKYFEHFTGSAPPLFILDPLLWIRSAYVSLYINSCFGLNKLLTNLTSLCQYHLHKEWCVLDK